VRPLTDQSFEIVAGARRYRAAQMAEAPTVPVRIVNLTDAEALEAQLIELSVVVKRFLSEFAGLHVVDIYATCRSYALRSQVGGRRLFVPHTGGTRERGRRQVGRVRCLKSTVNIRSSGGSLKLAALSVQIRAYRRHRCPKLRIARARDIWHQRPPNIRPHSGIR
jgi:hypothetical protein